MEQHRFNFVSFIFGLLFLGATAAHFGSDLWPNSLDSRWIWPALLVIAGIAVLGGAVTGMSGRDVAPEPSVPQDLPEGAEIEHDELPGPATDDVG